MDKLQTIREIAKIKNIKGEIKPSTRKNKKYMIKRTNKKTVHFGAKDYDDYLDHRNLKRRQQFHQRFKNNKGYLDPSSGLFYSQKLLW